MPVATTATNVAISCGFRTLRRITISGSESPITLIMNASTVPKAAPVASSACTIGMILATLLYIGTPITTARGHRPPGLFAHEARHEVFRHPAVNGGADRNAGHDVGPYLADDRAHAGDSGGGRRMQTRATHRQRA